MEELLDKLATYLKKSKNKSIETICKDLNLEYYQVYGLVMMLKDKGYLYDVIDGKVIKLDKPIKESDIYQLPCNLETVKLLLISDTHLASKYDRLDILRYLYQKAEDRGINYVLHSGDVVDGRSNRPQHVYELKETSYAGQRDYVVENYPESEIPTFMISGNHEAMWYKNNGSDIIRDICTLRPDLHYLGSDCEDMLIGKIRVRLYHGIGGSSYAKSYKLQKYLDSIPMEERPHILQTGHIHQAFYMKQGKTHCFQTSCLQDLTPYERSMGFNNDKSCWWVDVTVDKNGNPVQVNQELETFGKKLVRKK